MSDDEMTPDKLRAAFEPFMMRVAAYGGSIPAAADNSPAEAAVALTAALEAARMWLLEHPPDDAEKLSNTWLKAVGSDDESPACVNGHEFKLADGSRLFLWGYEGEQGYSVTLTAHPELDRNHDDVSGEIELGDIDTRGQLRRLASALGINLKEAP